MSDYITPPILTKYEYTRLIGTRALQISNNSMIFTELDDSCNSALDIAKKEFREIYNFPLSIRRILPNGNVEEYHLKDLIVSEYL